MFADRHIRRWRPPDQQQSMPQGKEMKKRAFPNCPVCDLRKNVCSVERSMVTILSKHFYMRDCTQHGH
jgi:hypothetical protein